MARAVDLSDHAIALRYRHAADGRDYQHDFGRGVQVKLEPGGTVKLTQRGGKKLWRMFPLDGAPGQVPFLVNAPPDSTAVPRRIPTTRSQGLLMARHSRHSSTRRRHARRVHKNPGRKARSRHAIPVVHYEANPRRRRHRGFAANPHHRRRHAMRVNPRRRHGYRRNPPLGLGLVVDGLKGGALTYGGFVVNRKVGTLIQGFLPTPTGTDANLMSGVYLGVAHLGGAIAASLLAAMIFPKGAAEIANGAFAEAINQVAMVTPAAPYLSAYAKPRGLTRGPAAIRPGIVRSYARITPGGGIRAYARPNIVAASNIGA